MGGNGDLDPKAKPTDSVLARILRIGRIRDAADANEAVRKRSAAIERARQRRARARRRRGNS